MNRPTARVTTMAAGCVVALTVAACGASSPPRTPGTSASVAPTSRPATTSAPPSSTAAPRTTATTSIPASTSAAPSTTSAAPSTTVVAPTTMPVTTADPSTGSTQGASRNDSGTSNGAHPVIVIDPGHCPSVHHIDHRTGLDVSDYENEPEMHDVYKVALLVRHQLQKAGYRVVMTKKSVDQRVNLARRAHIANRVHAALALSIHDQAGANGGIGFRAGNNTVYYQSVGTYRATPSGRRVYFRNKHLAKLSKQFGEIFRRQRANAQHTHINLQGNVGYNLGSRGLAAGNIWLVQLLSKVPWVYNEAGGNSSGRSGLDSSDRHTYARGLVAGVEHSVPLRKN